MRSALTIVAILFATACGSSTNGLGMQCRNDTGECVTSGGPPAAAIVTGVAVGVYAATACRAAGCPPPTRCNTESGRCEWPLCGEGQPSCPTGYECDTLHGRCE